MTSTSPRTAVTTIASCFTDQIVTTNANSGQGSLRQAIIDACDGSTISFDMTQVVSPITLTSELAINKNLTIQGPGANLLTISGNHASRVFLIDPNVTASLSGMTMAGSFPTMTISRQSFMRPASRPAKSSGACRSVRPTTS